jgi:hypothetical protein
MRSEAHESLIVEWSLSLSDKIKMFQQLVAKFCHIKFNEKSASFTRAVSWVRMDELSELDMRSAWLRRRVKCGCKM